MTFSKNPTTNNAIIYGTIATILAVIVGLIAAYSVQKAPKPEHDRVYAAPAVPVQQAKNPAPVQHATLEQSEACAATARHVYERVRSASAEEIYMDYANHESATFDRCYVLVTRRDEQPQTETLTSYLIDATEHHTIGLCVGHDGTVKPGGECWIDPPNGGHEHEVHPSDVSEWNDIARQFLDDDWLVQA